MESFAKLIAAGANILWPILATAAVYVYRKQIMNLYYLCCQQIAARAALKFGGIEIRGADLTKSDKEGANYRRETADAADLAARDGIYGSSRNLMLVNKIKPKGEIHQITNLSVYDIWVYLILHKNFGKLNDVRSVEYYFGKYFGRSKSEFGTKYLVEDGSEGFAVKIDAYGPMLCSGRVVFHDNSTVDVARYLDFESVGYRFSNATHELDKVNLLSREE